MDDAAIEAHLAKLRQLYVEATPRQRFHIAEQRIANPAHGPNLLVTCVAAVEGFARSVVMHCHATTQAELSGVYPRYRFLGPEELILEFLSHRALGSPESFFGSDDWRHFLFAVKYRNVLAHECTYLGQDISPVLVSACQRVLAALGSANGLTFKEA